MILDPHWLIEVMRGIVEIDPTENCDRIASEHVEHLESGVASIELLTYYLKEFISGSSDITLDHLLLILRSYCLIFPLQPEPKPLSSSEGGASYTEYIVPCKLPENLNYVDIPEERCCVFYFNFFQFLPDEIYHRLMCLASAASKPNMGERNKFSKQYCVFYNLHGTDWIIKPERDKHWMKFAFL